MLTYLGILHDPDGPSKRSVRHWVEMLVLIGLIMVLLALLRS